MARLDPAKLVVEYREGVTPVGPLMPRYYTLTHSDQSGELFLTIGCSYAFDKINPLRDEVLGEWRYQYNYYFWGTVYVDGQFGPGRAAIRNEIFIRELPLALEAIRFGDRGLFAAHPFLDSAPVYIYFQSSIPLYNRIEYWDTFASTALPAGSQEIK